MQEIFSLEKRRKRLSSFIENPCQFRDIKRTRIQDKFAYSKQRNADCIDFSAASSIK